MTMPSPQPDLLPRIAPGGIVFTFKAGPATERVALAGTFNCWDGQASVMRQVGSTTWQITLPLAPGRHLYKYVVNDRDWIRDPANPWISEDGQGNSCLTLSERGELLIRCGQITPTHPGALYCDHTASPSPAWLHDAVIYQLSARAFGGLAQLRTRLPYLHNLGVTAIWLMPIQPIGQAARSGTLGDPYAVRDFLAIDPALGDAAELRSLVDAAHAQGLRVILDWPLNRSSRDNPLTTQHPAWFTHDPYGAITYAVPNRHAFAGFDFAQPALRHYLIDAMRSWLARFDFDGLRFDDSDLTPLDFLREIRTALAAARPEIVLISQSYDELHHLGACDLTYEGGMRELISQVAQGLAAPLQIQRYWEESTYSFPRGALRMRWLEEKEQDRAFRYYGHALHCAAATLLLTLDGVPCVLMGQEFNEPSWRSWESLFEPFVLDWSALDKTTFQHYRALIALRTRHPAMRCGAVTFVPSGADRVVRYWRSVNDERICVTVNLSDGLRTPAAQTEPCRTLYLHAPGAVSTGAGTLPPFGSLIERAGSQPADQ